MKKKYILIFFRSSARKVRVSRTAQLLFLFCVLCLSSCHSENENPQASAEKFIQQAKQTSQKALLEEDKRATIVAATYQGARSRNPFEIPALVKNTKLYPNAILTHMALDNLKLVGVVIHHDQRWAIFRSNDGKLYRITTGMRVGLQKALLTQIMQNQVKFVVDMPVGTSGKEESHDVIMTTQESSS